jgi:MoxR-like ATPase
MNDISSQESLAARFVREVLAPVKATFVGKDEIIDLLGLCLVARENLFLLGPPGTAKSALVQEIARRLESRVFDYLLTRFTEPNELFGPFDIRRLRDGDLVTNTEGMLPEADFVFLDELLNANSAILNSLLMVLNERIFRRGRETRSLPTRIVVGASNRLPDDDALAALFDRFLLRVRCDYVPREELPEVLAAGWKLESSRSPVAATFTSAEVFQLSELVAQVDLAPIRATLVDLVHRLRHAGINVSDRRAVKLQRLAAASAVLCDRTETRATDLWVVKHIWDTEEQQDILDEIVRDTLPQESNATVGDHPRSGAGDTPDPERLARDLARIAERATQSLSDHDRSYLRDQVGVLAGRCQWIASVQAREFLDGQVQQLWQVLGERP